MENMLKAEKRLLSLFFNKPLLIDDFNSHSLYSEIAKSIYNRLSKEYRERGLKDSISQLTAICWFDNEPALKTAIKNIFLTPLDLFDINTEVLNNLLFDLEKETQKIENLNKLEEVQKSLVSNDINKADEILSSIRLKPVESLQGTADLIVDSMDNARIFKSGLQLDKYTGLLSTKSMMSIAGEPGSMKTYFAMYYILEILKVNPTFTATFFEKEMPASDIGLRLLSYVIGDDIQSIKTLLYNRDKEKLISIYKDIIKADPEKKSLLERFIVVPDYKFNHTGDIEKYIKRYKSEIYCIDYLQQMIRDADVTSGINILMSELKDMTNSNDSFGLLLSQVNDKELAKRNNRIPQQTDMQYGTRIIQNSEQTITLFNPSKVYAGGQPMTHNHYRPEDFYLIAHKTRDAKEPKNICPFKTSMKDSFFKEVTDTKEYERMTNWLDLYQKSMKNNSYDK